jgi:hypothetical protein
VAWLKHYVANAELHEYRDMQPPPRTESDPFGEPTTGRLYKALLERLHARVLHAHGPAAVARTSMLALQFFSDKAKVVATCVGGNVHPPCALAAQSCHPLPSAPHVTVLTPPSPLFSAFTPQLDDKGRNVHALKGAFLNTKRGKRIETIEDLAYIPIFADADDTTNARVRRDAETLLTQKCMEVFMAPLKQLSSTGIELQGADGQQWLCFPQVSMQHLPLVRRCILGTHAYTVAAPVSVAAARHCCCAALACLLRPLLDWPLPCLLARAPTCW